MTDTAFAPPPPASTAPRLERPQDSALRGVCSALARATGTDLVLWRVLFVVLTLFGGVGIALYLVAVAAIPREGQPRSLFDQLLRGPDRHLDGRQRILLVVVVVVVLLTLTDTSGVVVALVAAGLGYLWWRDRVPGRPVASLWESAAATPMSGEFGSTAASSVSDRVVTPRAPRSPLSGLTASLAVVVAAVLVLVGLSGEASIPAEVVLASALAVVGVGLVAGSFLGRAPWLVVLAVGLGAALLLTVGVRPALDAGVGEQSWQPTGSASYRLGVGEATLDLSGLETQESDPITVDARVDVGHLLVLVPPGLRVAVSAQAGLGEVLIDGVEHNGRQVEQDVDLGPAGSRQVRLELSVRTGAVEVRRG